MILWESDNLCVFKSQKMITGGLIDTEDEERQTLRPVLMLKETKMAIAL